MSVPEHLFRSPTRASIEALAKRFDLPFDTSMQDWEWEVADPDRIDEFLEAYRMGELDEDERFTLMETIIQSFEDAPQAPEADPRWCEVLNLLTTGIDLHISTVWYWAATDHQRLDDTWLVTPSIRKLLHEQSHNFAQQGVGGQPATPPRVGD